MELLLPMGTAIRAPIHMLGEEADFPLWGAVARLWMSLQAGGPGYASLEYGICPQLSPLLIHQAEEWKEGRITKAQLSAPDCLYAP